VNLGANELVQPLELGTQMRAVVGETGKIEDSRKATTFINDLDRFLSTLTELIRNFQKSFAIAGIGINVNQTVEDFSEELRPHAISLAIALDQPVDRQEFAVALLRNLDRTYREIFASYEGGSSSLLLDVKNQAAKSH